MSVPWVTTIGAVSFQDSAHHAQQERTIRVGQAQPLEVAVNFTIDVRHGAGSLGVHLFDGATGRLEIDGFHGLGVSSRSVRAADCAS